jgi:hypothetical protein
MLFHLPTDTLQQRCLVWLLVKEFQKNLSCCMNYKIFHLSEFSAKNKKKYIYINKAITVSLVLYACETWSFTSMEKQASRRK